MSNNMVANMSFKKILIALKPSLSQPKPWAHDQGKGLQGCGPRGKLESEKKCEGMNPHTPKGASTLRIGALMDSRIFKE